MKSASRNTQSLNRRDVLKLAGGALGLGALSYAAGLLNQPAPGATTPGSPLPNYLDDDTGLPVLRGPYLQQASMAAFLLPASAERLSALCDHRLNLASDAPWKYTPLLYNLVMIYSQMQAASLDVRDSQAGLIPETELSFWLPTVALRRSGAGYVPDHVAWFLPILLVDEGSAIATGREVYGFNKQLAVFDRAEDIHTPGFTASVLGKAQSDPAGKAAMQPLIELRASAPAGAVEWHDLADARAALQAAWSGQMVAASGGQWLDFAARLATDSAPLVFLKQFRDAADTRLACYQALVEAPVRVRSFSQGGRLGQGELNIHPLASHPLAAWLGLASQMPVSGVWMELDFSLEAGREVWRRI